MAFLRRSVKNSTQIWNFMRNYSHEVCDLKHKNGLVVGLYQKEGDLGDLKLTPSGLTYNTRSEGRLLTAINDCGLNGQLGRSKIFSALDKEFGTVCVVGLGKENVSYCERENLDVSMENVRIASGIGAKILQDHGCRTIYVDSMDYPEQAAEGSALSIWKYQENKAKKIKQHIPKLELYDSAELDTWTRGLFKADAQNLARTLVEAPANQVTPLSFAQTAVDALCPCGVNVEIRNQEWIESNCLRTFLNVAKGSCEPPVMLEINYNGNDRGDSNPIVLIGSGMTYNNGGIIESRCNNVPFQRAEMSGAASVVAAIRAAAALSLPLNIVGIVPLCENMSSGMALKPGDVIQTLDNKSIGYYGSRNFNGLMLADILVHSQNIFKPKIMLDVCTTANHITAVLGQAATGVFTNSKFLWDQVKRAGAFSGDRVWQLPLWDYYSYELKNNEAVDLSFSELPLAQTCIGAAFLKEFISSVDWIHFDVSNTGARTETLHTPYLEAGRMSGRPVRTLIQLLVQLGCQDEKEESKKSCP